jgi:hypothetical protein
MTEIVRRQLSDAKEICKLRHKALPREADEQAETQICSVRQNLDDCRYDFARRPILNAVNQDKEIVRSTRTSVHKFFVKPDTLQQGIRSQLLDAMFPAQDLRFGVKRFREPRPRYLKKGRDGRLVISYPQDVSLLFVSSAIPEGKHTARRRALSHFLTVFERSECIRSLTKSIRGDSPTEYRSKPRSKLR